MRVTGAVVFCLLIVPSAAAAVAFEGELRYAEPPLLEGATRLASRVGALDLARAGSFEITFASARGFVSTSRWTDVGLTPAMNVSTRDRAPEITGLDYAAGALRGFRCGDGCRIALMEGGAAWLGVEGEARGVVPVVAEAYRHWGGFPADGPLGSTGAGSTSFYYEIEQGWLRSDLMPVGTPFAEGELRLLLANVSVDVVDEHGARDVLDVTPTIQTTSAGLAGTGSVRERRVPFALLTLQGATLHATATEVSFAAPSWEVETTGALASPDATGELRIGSRRIALEHEPFDAQGRLHARLATDEEGLSVLAADQGGPIRGDAERLRVGGVAVSVPTTTPLPVKAAGGALAALLALLPLLRLLVYSPFYSRLAPRELLENERRRAVYELLRARPGISTPEVCRTLGMVRVVAQHHLRLLEAHGFVVSRVIGRARAYYLPEAAGVVRELPRGVLGDPTRRRIAETIQQSGAPLSQRDLTSMTGLSQRLVSYHLAKLHAAGVVRVEEGTPLRYGAAA